MTSQVTLPINQETWRTISDYEGFRVRTEHKSENTNTVARERERERESKRQEKDPTDRSLLSFEFTLRLSYHYYWHESSIPGHQMMSSYPHLMLYSAEILEHCGLVNPYSDLFPARVCLPLLSRLRDGEINTS